MSAVTLGNAGGDESLVATPSTTTVNTKGISAGTGISLGSSASAVTITNSDPASGVTLTNAGTTSLVNDGTGPSLAAKGLVAGTNVTFGTSATDVTINADTVTLTSAGGTETLVNDGTGQALATKGLTAGSNITLSSTSTAITIASPTPACRIINTSPSALINGGAANITFDTEIYDPTNMHSTVTNTDRVNIATTGLYNVAFCMQFSASAPTGAVYFHIYRNSSGVVKSLVSVGPQVTASITYVINLSTIAQLSSGDYVYVSWTNNSGVTVTPAYVDEYSPLFSVTYVGSN